MSKLIVDFDSTLFPLLDALADRRGDGLSYEACHTWDTLTDWEGGVDNMLHSFEKVMGASMLNYKPFPYAAAMCRALWSEGVNIYVVTDRPDHLTNYCYEWLNAHDIPFSQFLGNTPYKVYLAEEMGAIGMVDDKPETIRVAHRHDLPITSLAHPYSSTAAATLHVPVYEDWTGIYKEVMTWHERARNRH